MTGSTGVDAVAADEADAVAHLADREDVAATLRRYAQGVDQRDWELYRRAFAPGAVVEVPGYLPGPVSPEEFAGHLAGTFDDARISGQHLLANTLLEVRGDRAHAVTEFLATTVEHARPAGERDGTVRRQVAGGLYVDDLARTPDGWRIRRRVLVRKSDEHAVLRYSDADLTATATAGAARSPAVAGL